jgi:hypothetical protein
MHFSSQESGATENEDFWKPIFDLATVLNESVVRSPQLTSLIQFYRNGEIKEFYEEYVEPINDELIQQLSASGGLNKQLVRSPLKDLGEAREIDWKCFGSHWKVRFKNDYDNTVVAEEFTAVMQILLTEIALTRTELYLVPNEIIINITIGDNIEIQQETKTDDLEWNVQLKQVEKHSLEELHLHNSVLTAKIWSVVNEISLTPELELQEYLKSRMRDHSLTDKLFILTSYQNCYRNLIERDNYDQLKRNNFSEYLENITYSENKALSGDNLISNKYDQTQSLEFINIRYQKSETVAGITIQRVKEDSSFQEFLRECRGEGWLDWQITMSLMNSVVDLKTKLSMNNASDTDPDFEIKYQQAFFKMTKILEKDNYIELSVPDLIENMKMQLDALPVQVLRSFNLQHKIRMFKDTSVVTQVLNSKFNFNIDDLHELSPFSDID